MALAETEDVKPLRKGPLCSVCTLLRTMDTEDVATLTRWMDDIALNSSTISVRLKAAKLADIAGQTISRHRAGRCWEQRRGTR